MKRYEELAEEVAAMISTQLLLPGDKLPSVHSPLPPPHTSLVPTAQSQAPVKPSGRQKPSLQVVPVGQVPVSLQCTAQSLNVGVYTEQVDALSSIESSSSQSFIEAFVPDEPFRDGSAVEVRSMTVDQVVLSVARYDAGGQQASGQFVELSEGGGVRLRPWFIRYSTVAQLDEMAATAGLALEHRWSDVAKTPFDDTSDRHLRARKIKLAQV